MAAAMRQAHTQGAAMITFRIGDVALNMGASDFESFVLDPNSVGTTTLGANILNLVGNVGSSLLPTQYDDPEHWIFTSSVNQQEVHFYGQGMSFPSYAPVSTLTVTDALGVEIFGFDLSEPMVLNPTEMIGWGEQQIVDFFLDVFNGE